MHKIIRKNRLDHNRKTGREDSNKDILCHLLLSSDPLLAAKRNCISKKNLHDTDINNYIEQTENSDENSMDEYASLISLSDNSSDDFSDDSAE